MRLEEKQRQIENDNIQINPEKVERYDQKKREDEAGQKQTRR
jgi:hypothetical protein